MTAVPRLVVTAPSSGHGKTAVAVGLLAAFAASGLRAAGFKVGPDHTDAAYLGLAAGRPGRNLDPRLVGQQLIAPLFAHGAAGTDVAVVEGTMGLFDSLAGRSEADSTAGVAGLLRAPVVLVVDVAAMGQSVAALVHGFRAYDELIWLGGVVLNRVASDRHEQLLQEALDEIGVPVLGALRRGELAAGGASALPPRGHGVVPVLHRAVEATRAVRRLGETITGALDMERLLSLARSAPRLSVEPWSPTEAIRVDQTEPGGRRPVIALAGAPTVSYGYAETAELLTAAGASVAAVDPLRDETLPAGTDALVVCGGLPESYAEELSANARLRGAVAELAHAGRPVIAEGTGLLWLAKEFDGRAMCAVFDATGVTTERMVVGYRDATARTASPVAEPGDRVVGYKHHRAALNPRAGQTPAWSWNGSSPEGFVWRRVHASQLTLHWAGSPEIARRLVAAARGGTGGQGGAAAQGGTGGHGYGVPNRPGAAQPPAQPVPHVSSQAPAHPAAQPLSHAPAAPVMAPAGDMRLGPQRFGRSAGDGEDVTEVLRGPTRPNLSMGGADRLHADRPQTDRSQPDRPQAGRAPETSMTVRVEYLGDFPTLGGRSVPGPDDNGYPAQPVPLVPSQPAPAAPMPPGRGEEVR